MSRSRPRSWWYWQMAIQTRIRPEQVLRSLFQARTRYHQLLDSCQREGGCKQRKYKCDDDRSVSILIGQTSPTKLHTSFIHRKSHSTNRQLDGTPSKKSTRMDSRLCSKCTHHILQKSAPQLR